MRLCFFRTHAVFSYFINLYKIILQNHLRPSSPEQIKPRTLPDRFFPSQGEDHNTYGEHLHAPE